MLDRIVLLSELNSLQVEMKATAQRALEKTLNKAIGQLLAGLPLAEAMSAPQTTRQLISIGFEESLTMAEIKKVSKLWEPKRTVPASIAHTELAQDLTDLMDGRRKPFVPTKLTLPQARSLGSADARELKLGLERFATAAQLKALLKKWDKHSALNKGGKEPEIRERLLSLLLHRAEPDPKPAK
jgi:hypothetical protein